ncbi:MAG: DUF937 domain-containing protein [Chloroflexota bacterium]|jgi:hypothetical protein
MAGILDSMSSMLTPDVVGKLGKGLGIDPSLLEKGMTLAGPLVIGGLAKQTSTKAGAAGFADLLSNAEAAAGESAAAGMGDQLAGLLGGASDGNLGGMLDGVLGLVGASGGTGADMMEGILGQGVNAIGGTLSGTLGFDVKPMLGMAVPMVMGLVNKAKKEGNLDAAGIADMLQSENKAYADNPANRANLDLINEAMAAGDQAAALRGKFSDVDWMKVRLAPIGATYLVASASPSKGTSAVKEFAAAVDAVGESVKSASPTSLLGTAFGGGLNSSELDVLAKDAPSSDSILQSISAARSAVIAHSPADAAAYSDMIVKVTEGVANAAKEGGFLGIGGKTVSDAEAAAISAIKAALN